MTPFDQLVSIARTAAERRALYEFRYQVYIEEMGKPYSHADHERKQLSDALDDKATLLYASKDGRIIGTVRINWGDDRTAFRAFTESCGLADFQCFPAGSFSFCSRLMVHRDYRYSAIAAALATRAYETGRGRSTQFNFVHCAPRLLPLFERMGFRQYKDHFDDPEVGEQIPLVLVIEDIDHLRASRSPFLGTALTRRNSRQAALWFSQQLFTYRYPTKETTTMKSTNAPSRLQELKETVAAAIEKFPDNQVCRKVDAGEFQVTDYQKVLRMIFH